MLRLYRTIGLSGPLCTLRPLALRARREQGSGCEISLLRTSSRAVGRRVREGSRAALVVVAPSLSVCPVGIHASGNQRLLALLFALSVSLSVRNRTSAACAGQLQVRTEYGYKVQS